MILPTLRLYGPITGLGTFAKDISDRANEGGWRRSVRSKGGFWRGSFTLYGEIGELATWFDNYLGYRFIETAGGETWKGMVYDMLLVNRGVGRRRSLTDPYNHIFTTYINTDDPPKVVTSAAVQNSRSIDRFGRREQLLLLDGMPQTAAEAQRDRFLTMYAWPWSRPAAVNTRLLNDETSLEVTVCGDIFTANWRYESVGGLDGNQGALSYTDEGGDPTFTDDAQDFNDWKTTSGDSRYSIWVANDDGTTSWGYLGDVVSASEVRVYQDKARATPGWNNTDPTGKTPASYNIYGPVSEWINDIINNDCEFLQVGKITENLLQTHPETPIPRRAWDIMSQLTDFGDENGTPYWIYADLGGRVIYEPIPTEPRYFLRDGKYYSTAGGQMEVNPWQMRPGVVRDLSYPMRQTEYNPWLQDVRDFYVSGWDIGVNTGIVPQIEEYAQDEILAAQLNYQAQLERRRQTTEDKPSGPHRRPDDKNWYDILGIPKDVWLSMSVPERRKLIKKWREEKRGG